MFFTFLFFRRKFKAFEFFPINGMISKDDIIRVQFLYAYKCICVSIFLFFLLRKFDLEHKNNLPKFIKRETWRISLKNLKKAVGEWDGKLLLYSNI